MAKDFIRNSTLACFPRVRGILWMTHLLKPYIILAIAFLFSAGFAFGPPAHSSVIAEMVSAEELGSAYTLAGLQMDVPGIIGPCFRRSGFSRDLADLLLQDMKQAIGHF